VLVGSLHFVRNRDIKANVDVFSAIIDVELCLLSEHHSQPSQYRTSALGHAQVLTPPLISR
jgi:hypothetical protein